MEVIELARAAISATADQTEPANKRRRPGVEFGGERDDTALEAALAGIDAIGLRDGFPSDILGHVVALACDAAVISGGCAQSKAAAMCRRILMAALPNGDVNAETVVKLVGAMNGMPVKSRLASLEWLLAVWDAIPAPSIDVVRRLYFVFFHFLQYDTLCEAAACIVCRLSVASHVTRHRVQILSKLFDRTGDVWVAALLCKYKALATDVFVLPFDERRVIGPESKLAHMLETATLTTKAHRQWRAAVASKRGVLQQKIAQAQSEPLRDAAAEEPLALASLSMSMSEPKTRRNDGTVSVIPPATYLRTAGLIRVGSIDSLARIAEFAGSNTAPVFPDHMASVISSNVELQFASVSVAGNHQQVGRMESWASHMVTQYCVSGKASDCCAVLNAIYAMSTVLRDIPVAAEFALPRLLSSSSETVRRSALRLVQYVPAESFIGREEAALKSFFAAPLSGANRTALLAFSSLSALISRLASQCRGVERRAFFTRKALRSVDSSEVKSLVHSLVAWAWQAAVRAIPSAAGDISTQDAVLALMESVAACRVPVPVSEEILATLFASDNCMVVSRCLGVAADLGGCFANQSSDDLVEERIKLDRFTDGIRAKLLDPLDEHSIVKHRALSPVFERYIGAVTRELRDGDATRSREELVHDALTVQRPNLLKFLGARDLFGLCRFLASN